MALLRCVFFCFVFAVALTDIWGCSISKCFILLISVIVLKAPCADLERRRVVGFFSVYRGFQSNINYCDFIV